jgi:putative OPT family oligopeptide transporter
VTSDGTLPEITVKAFVLSVGLAAILAAANAYLGLFAGMTVSASIPAAVTSMAVLRLFPTSNILENNIVQTAASSGEALAAGVIFTIPALMLIGYWTSFDYAQTATLALVGGMLGVLFTIPLRRALIVEAQLRFPEGVATAEVLKAGSAQKQKARGEAGSGRQGVRKLIIAACIGAAVKFGESGLRLWTEAWEDAWKTGGTVFYGGLNLSPALLAVGFIIELNTALVVFLGGAIGWLVGLPLYGFFTDLSEPVQALPAAKTIWSTQMRFVGIGAMLVGGVWALVQLRRPLWLSLARLGSAYSRSAQAPVQAPRTDRDASLLWILALLVLSLVLMLLLYEKVMDSFGVAVMMTLVMGVAAFLFSTVAGYMAGIVGSSSNPVSGVTIATIMLASLVLLLVLGPNASAGPAAALLIGAVVCCAAAMGGDNLQDLKTGYLVGATPWKQQVMQVVGVTAGAVVIVPVLTLLQAKYGIGPVTAEHPYPLSAPQATLMGSLAQAVFGRHVPWQLMAVGAGIGIAIILLDRRQQARGAALRLPVLGVALGIYLPLKLSAAILIGGLVSAAVRRQENRSDGAASHGLLAAAGLVTGEALMGVGLAVPIALHGFWPRLGKDPFAWFDVPPLGPWPGVLVFAGAAWWLYRAAGGMVTSEE